jgi:hypothetical protein
MHVIAGFSFAVAILGLVLLTVRVRRLSRRLRENLSGCAGYPVLKSSRCPSYIVCASVPLRAGKARAAERSWAVRS